MTPFMTELAVSDLAASRAWYRDGLGLKDVLVDEANGFVLFECGGGRLAIKRGTPSPGGVTIHFRVADLDETVAMLTTRGLECDGEIKASDEGYRRATFKDPDGYGVIVFEFLE
jgi:catechol 2,3-dioxygenase-like lactoylglutathione lyase family enzyme